MLTGEIAKTLPPDLPSSDPQRETLAKRQANAAVALLRMNQSAQVWPLLKHSPDPRVRSYLIHRLSPLGTDSRAVVKRLDEETDITICRALLLSLGEFNETDFTLDERKVVLPKVEAMYRTASDPGLHGAAEWLLRTWKRDGWLTEVNADWAKDGEGRDKKVAGIKELVAKGKEKTPAQWYINTQGQTMVVIPGPVEFRMGSPKSEKDREEREVQHKRRIGRSFALASQSVTWGQYLKYAPQDTDEREERYSPTLECPANYISWPMAAGYCNWLSKAEGIDPDEWCYEITGKVVKLKKNYLSLSGYRLPSEAEMEYATRAGALTSWYYGETDSLLVKYAWYNKNAQEKSWPVGLLKPNDFGFFDAHGNVFSWCQERYQVYPTGKGEEVTEDREDEMLDINIDVRVLRGGSFFYLPSNVRSAYRNYYAPANRFTVYGFRPARTFTP